MSTTAGKDSQLLHKREERFIQLVRELSTLKRTTNLMHISQVQVKEVAAEATAAAAMRC